MLQVEHLPKENKAVYYLLFLFYFSDYLAGIVIYKRDVVAVITVKGLFDQEFAYFTVPFIPMTLYN
ncbi:hypothetical protein GEO21_05015 [Sphingobacterium faecium]|uniref:hypothetical protein n=1 Tax=Sphingobacterium faecium TaxID=34087 RepID=UPI00129101E5|nr:hypothetical protein [Sphingobacterium faecium]MQP26879.1 hypothetical protein [Sphingobacterium faecium]